MKRFHLGKWRPRTTIFVIVAVVLVLILVGIFVLFNTMVFRPTKEVKLADANYSLWVADSEREREQGLSGVDSLASDGGLLMEFESDDMYGIWMKDMNFPLDIIWLNKDKIVVHGVVDAQPEDPVKTIYQPKVNARYVIELPVGSIEKAKIGVGDKVEFSE